MVNSCKWGHTFETRLKSRGCPACFGNEYRKEQMRRIRAKNPLRNKESCRKWRLNNLEQSKRITKRYRTEKPEVIRHLNALRKADKIRATPKWADLKAIEEFYGKCPKGYHVDHYYPLRGKTVSGLHVLNNLQYLPACDNIRKGNKHPEEYYAN